jgi:hypothetical protein
MKQMRPNLLPTITLKAYNRALWTDAHHTHTHTHTSSIAGEDQPNLAAHVLRHVHVEGHVSINDKRLSMYDDSGMIRSPIRRYHWCG